MMLQLQNLVRSLTGAAVLTLTLQIQAAVFDPQDSTAEKQRKLIAVLKSDAPSADKALVCKQLAIYGGPEAVPALAPLLSNPELSSWARIALEAIPDAAADAALRDALTRVQGRQLVGVINTIGVRRDAQAISGLSAKLKDADADIASAAAAALGRIGGNQATAILEKFLPTSPEGVRSEVAEGCVRCAERYLNEGNNKEAIRLYDLVRNSSVPRQRIIEAIRGAILARKSEGLPLLMEQLRSEDRARFGIGLRTARELSGRDVTLALAEELERSGQDRQALLLLVLADRADAAALPTIQKAARSGPKKVRLAALTALDRLNNPAVVPVLLDVAAENDPDLEKAARVALARLPGKEVDNQLLNRLPQSAGKMRQVLLELAGQRQIAGALPLAMQCLNDADAVVRSAAIATIGLLGEEKQIADLIKQLKQTQAAKDQGDLEKAMLAIASRQGARCLPHLLPLAENGDVALRIIALHTLASVGGPEALAAVKNALNDKETTVQDEAVRTLSTWPNSWPDDAAVAEPLLTLAKTGKKMSHQVLGLRGYLQYIQTDKKLKDEDKLAKVNDVLPLVKRVEEKRLVIGALGTIPSASCLEPLMTYAADRALADDACSAIIALAPRGDLKGATKELRRKALQVAVEKAPNDATKKKADKALKGVR
ncbi:MAG: HEAT repeat domain-containing protein [Verrucomicrobiota bacterium]